MAKAMLQEALVDQSQVYLPINNALSSVGHVHGFIQELGQARTLNAIRLHPVATVPKPWSPKFSASVVRSTRCEPTAVDTRRASSTWQAASTI